MCGYVDAANIAAGDYIPHKKAYLSHLILHMHSKSGDKQSKESQKLGHLQDHVKAQKEPEKCATKIRTRAKFDTTNIDRNQTILPGSSLLTGQLPERK